MFRLRHCLGFKRHPKHFFWHARTWIKTHLKNISRRSMLSGQLIFIIWKILFSALFCKSVLKKNSNSIALSYPKVCCPPRFIFYFKHDYHISVNEDKIVYNNYKLKD